jgi:dihydroneopterin aldolase/2-amino-4-hydroxy-6-hydroxymethyldihydropteridine diphosphokinase
MEDIMDKIIIQDLEVFGYHGVMSEERALGQKFLISVEFFLNTRRAGISDALKYSLNYGDAARFIHEFMNTNTFQLIEAAAEQLANALLLNYEIIEKLRVTIKKPWAPIRLHVDYAAIEIERGWHTAYIALGSNEGDKLNYLEEAVQSIKENKNCRFIKVSDIIITKPYGPVPQEDFLNGCLMIQTLYSPLELLGFLQSLEQAAGRTREVHWGPRTLDLDILMYDDIILDHEELVIPHPEMHKRAFVLEPLNQIAPNLVHPVLNARIRDLVEQ